MKKILILQLTFLLFSCSNKSWREASRESAGISPKPSDVTEDIVQIFYARAFSWKGYFGIHPWISWIKAGEKSYTVSEVTAWNVRRSGSTVSIRQDYPDRLWFDSYPKILFEARGKKATKIIEEVKVLIEKYPFKEKYRVWPGPNSNTFISYLIRNIDELDIELPSSAIGKDFYGFDNVLSNSASNTGFTFSLFGAFGFTLGLAEGIELNILGLHFGLDLWTPALKIPFFGRLGFEDKSF